MKRRDYLSILAGLGLLGSGGYVFSQKTPRGEQTVDEPTATPTPADTPTPTPTPTSTPEFSETKTHGEMSLTVLNAATEPELTIDGEQRKPGEGNLFLLVELLAENKGDSLDNPPRELTYVNGDTEYEAKGSGGSEGELDSPQKELYTEGAALGGGATMRGWVYGPIPEDLNQVTFRWHYSSFKAEERDIEWEIPVPK
ncbi:hypothetical protein [Haloparvum sp. PAK95]|uniref:hypothetical protein n=1 Tax=Haloparvum sp. PAK95 TaxID=3418962 RepID=UPI003D2F344B